jgi:ribosomal protein S18 acetylase RimI-like enzyme
MEFKIRERVIFEVTLEKLENRRKKVINFIRNYIKADQLENKESKNFDLKNYKPENLSTNTYSVFSASLENNRIIGACISELYEGGLLKIDKLIVGKEYRRQGVGLMLILKVIGYAKKNGIHNIQCVSLSIDKESKKFLKKAGFRKVGKLRRYLGKQDYYIWEYLP